MARLTRRATKWIEDRANAILADGMKEVRRVNYHAALGSPNTHRYDFVSEYVNDLGSIIDFDPIRDARPVLGADPLGGASVAYWGRIAEKYGLSLDVVDTPSIQHSASCTWIGTERSAWTVRRRTRWQD